MTYDEIRSLLLSKVRDKIQANTERLNWTANQIQSFQQNQLKILLDYAKEKSSYYRKKLHSMTDFENIPPLTKEDAMNHWDDICCVPGLTKNMAENHLRQYRENEISNPFFHNKYYITATGGSSGLRGLFIWDLDYFATVGYAAFRYQYQDELAKPIKGQKKVAAVTAPTLIHASTPLFTITLDDSTMVKHYSCELNIINLCQELNQFQPTHLIGYSSIINELAYRALGGNLTISPQRISTNSEPLEEETRALVRKVWGIEINNMWGSVEMGMAGIESDKHYGLFISDDLLILESVDDNLKPVSNPANAKKLLVTNLFNLAFPLIRYVVDDTVDIEKTSLSGFRIAKDIEGRADTWFMYTNHIKVHPIVFRSVLGQDPGITDYQVSQTANGAIVRLVLNNEINISNLKIQLENALAQQGLVNPIVQIEILPFLDRHPETGKLKRFFPL